MSTAEPRVGVPDGRAALERYRALLNEELRAAVLEARTALQSVPPTEAMRDDFYARIEYHLGWRLPDLTRAGAATFGKLLRPTLLLLACELTAGARGMEKRERERLVRRALPAAASVELIHNFSLVHDDIEDGDEERRHRPTLWKLWGVPQAINTGDAIFAIARHALWKLVELGVSPAVVVRLAQLTDRTCLELCEGQYLDMSYERSPDITVDMYLDMIGRKTAALMGCAMEMGAMLGGQGDSGEPAQVDAMERIGHGLGMAFQLRDDLLGIWAREEELGKTPAGDLRRKKMSLPVLHALQTASGADAQVLRAIYAEQRPATEEQIAGALEVLERTGARHRVRGALREQVVLAREALEMAAGSAVEAREARDLLQGLLDFVAEAAEDGTVKGSGMADA